MKTSLILLFIFFAAYVALARSEADTNTSQIYNAKEELLATKAHHLAKNDEQNFFKIGSNQTIVLKRGPERAELKFKDVYAWI